jgi:hypothetical protein
MKVLKCNWGCGLIKSAKRVQNSSQWSSFANFLILLFNNFYAIFAGVYATKVQKTVEIYKIFTAILLTIKMLYC